MPVWFSDLLEKSQAFIPHGHCYLWIPGLLWLHVVSDALIGTAYIGISLILYLLVRKIRLPFSPIFIAFGLFIGLCGTTHFMAIWTIWNPDYWLDGLLKGATAAASVATALGLYVIRPQVEELVDTARLSEERRTQLETTNAELEILYNKIKDLDELKTQFFANVSHELRTPLALILAPAEHMLGDANLTENQRRQLQSISRNGKSLLKQVNDLLDVAKLEEGKMEIQYARLDLVRWFHRISSHFEVTAEHRNIDYHVSAPETLTVEVDPDMLERVLINLLSNAFKFTPADGSIHVVLDSDADDLCFSVRDTGPGISPEQHQVIFERFRQADGGATRQHGGTGLGLAIARDLIELHHGQIQLQSIPGSGAQFTVRVPLRAPRLAKIKDTPFAPSSEAQVMMETVVQELSPALPNDIATPLSHLPGRPSVLVVEDNREMNNLITDILGHDYNVVPAFDGQEGLKAALAVRPDLVVTDIMMPGVSGDQLVAELRGCDQFNTTPILLLTAKADDDLRVKLLQNGAQDYLTKPFLPQELAARAANLLAIKRAGDTLRMELASASTNVEGLAQELAVKHRHLQIAMDATEVAREQAERANQVKSQFLGLISHEMRTPVSIILMNTEMISLRLGYESDCQDPQLERVIRASHQLSTLIEGVIEYTLVESGKIMAHCESVDPWALAREVVEAGQLQVSSPRVSLVLAPPTVITTPFTTDPRLLRVALNNLVSNALKFTNQGEVTLHVAAREGWHIFAVEDTGMGIPEADISRIFLPFEQLEPIKRKSVPGVGLGLALTKEIIESLGGKIEVTSQIEAGSTFTVLLPSNPVHPYSEK